MPLAVGAACGCLQSHFGLRKMQKSSREARDANMKIRWLALLLLVVLAGASSADGFIAVRQSGPRPSHRHIDGGLAGDRNPESLLASRLLKEKEQEQFASGIKDLARKLLE